MERRMYSSPLRSVKRGVVAIGIIMLSLSSVVLFARPAHAEGFLRSTLRCTVDALMFKDCRVPQQPPAPVAPASPTAPTSPTTQPQQPQPSPAPDPSPYSSEHTPQLYQPLPIDIAQVEGAQPSAPDLPHPTHRQPLRYEPATYASYRYGMVKGEQTVAQVAVLEPSHEGWHILGVAWYWWALGCVAAGGLIVWRRKLKNKHTLSIAK